MAGRFVSEPIEPEPGSFDTAAMATGEPGLPARFRWRGRVWAIVAVLERRRNTGPCTHGSAERYVRRHDYLVETEDGARLRLYCDRQPRSARDARRRWWVFSVEREPPADHPEESAAGNPEPAPRPDH